MDFTNISAAANKIFQEPLADWINRSNPILEAMQKKGVSSDRVYLKGRLNSNHEAGAIADGATVTVTDPKTDYAGPSLAWSTYIAKFSVTKRTLAMATSQPGELGRILQTEIQEASKDLADKIAADIFAGNVTNGLFGVQSMISDSNTYAGIDRSQSANANYRAVVVDAGTGGPPVTTTSELSTDLLYLLDEEYFAVNGYGWAEQPGRFTGVSNRQLLTKYRSMMETIDLSSLSTAHFVNQANSSGMLGIGKTGFMGVPFIRDRNVVAASTDLDDSGRLYILDMSQIYLAVLEPDRNAAMIHQSEGFTTAPDVSGIRATINFLGATGETVQGYVSAYVQLATPDPKKAGAVLKNVKIN